MTSITIRKLDKHIKTQLKMRAAQKGHSMEEEARRILRNEFLAGEEQFKNFGQIICQRFVTLGGINLSPYPRESLRNPPDFTS